MAKLSSREMEVAQLVSQGKTNVEIGRTLKISHKTVEKHLDSIYRNLRISNRTELAVYIAKGGR